MRCFVDRHTVLTLESSPRPVCKKWKTIIDREQPLRTPILVRASDVSYEPYEHHFTLARCFSLSDHSNKLFFLDSLGMGLADLQAHPPQVSRIYKGSPCAAHRSHPDTNFLRVDTSGDFICVKCPYGHWLSLDASADARFVSVDVVPPHLYFHFPGYIFESSYLSSDRSFIYACGYKQPDHSTIDRFYRVRNSPSSTQAFNFSSLTTFQWQPPLAFPSLNNTSPSTSSHCSLLGVRCGTGDDRVMQIHESSNGSVLVLQLFASVEFLSLSKSAQEISPEGEGGTPLRALQCDSFVVHGDWFVAKHEAVLWFLHLTERNIFSCDHIRPVVCAHSSFGITRTTTPDGLYVSLVRQGEDDENQPKLERKYQLHVISMWNGRLLRRLPVTARLQCPQAPFLCVRGRNIYLFDQPDVSVLALHCWTLSEQ